MDINPQDLAKHLRKPQGEKGIEVGDFMHKGNSNFYKQLIEAVEWKDGMKVLEIGMGSGKHVVDILLQAAEIEYVGVDYSSTMVEQAKINNPGQVFIQQDFHEMNVDIKDFDLVFTVNTVYFLDDLEKAFFAVKNHLGKDGIFIIGKRPKEDLERLNAFTQFGFNKYSNEVVVEALMNAKLDVVEVLSFKDPSFKMGEEEVQLHSDLIKSVHGN